jgi:ABC-2 type transport system ATP-binding protein
MRHRLRPAALDIGLTAAMGAVFVASALPGRAQGRPLDGLGWALLAANILPLLAVRRHPLAVLLLLCLAYPTWAALEYPTHLLQSLPTLAALGVAGAAPRPLWLRALALLAPVEMMAAVLLGFWDVDVLEIGYVAIVFVVVWAFGVAIAARRDHALALGDHARALEEKTAALQQAREELARRAVTDERTRIARDLHDIVAHAMSVITVQAGVGAHLIEQAPQQAAGALRVIEETGRGALEDMRRLLRALRSDDVPTEPQPGFASLDLLAANAQSAGIPVQVQIEGAARPLAAGLELSAYRIVQEAFTNIVKHAPGARVGLDPDAHGDRLRRRIGSQLQSSALPDRLRVGETLELFARTHDRALPVAELGRRWGLAELWRRPFAKLSGGQQQRLFIALALVNQPEVVFFDELTTGLDPQARRATWDLVRRVRDDGATVVLVTHFMEEAENLCDRVAIVDRGRVVATGTPTELAQRTGAARRVTFTWPDADLAWLSRVPGVERVTRSGSAAASSAASASASGGAGAVEVLGGGPLAVRVAAALAGRGVLPEDFRTHHPNLEDVFLSLTGRDLRA